MLTGHMAKEFMRINVEIDSETDHSGASICTDATYPSLTVISAFLIWNTEWYRWIISSRKISQTYYLVSLFVTFYCISCHRTKKTADPTPLRDDYRWNRPVSLSIVNMTATRHQLSTCPLLYRSTYQWVSLPAQPGTFQLSLSLRLLRLCFYRCIINSDSVCEGCWSVWVQ